ncbi:Uncharacterized protein conserved in bacteria [Providencia rustigianii]|uniref:HutD n=1 Tax=Providencia rustigianii DSM 4541 TaxID=500637 RepID=D1NXZ8_9GAMM|nr:MULTISPECIES: HutD family protein [Providencia]EFB73846.1 hypothetical protein PROVRUST_05119 [Providencia rustigianii DSM 4541]MTC57296.1 hypothetical protein [Providencia rustigianii]SPY77418.1 Uncharacterized protein conserved in bacteria [Providencia rustigianii]SUC26804.1 Uncharacterized protein conserved in bacteria [Providencia rustigianii]VEB69307.1 Uncharacterized protein conserved in bacteria [Providencia rustigianii]
MKIKCFSTTDLPVFEWNDNCGTSQEVFCWPVASDYSLRASIAKIEQSSFLKQYPEGERLTILLDNQTLRIHDNHRIDEYFHQVGESIRCPAELYVNVELQQPIRLMNFIYRSDRWNVRSYLIDSQQQLPAHQAGLVYVLSGEWLVSGGNCERMSEGDGGWWLPDIRTGELTPCSFDSQLLWIECIPC